ncbi:ABC transporter substrate-binding protein [Solihabitans fulvus]|uniref:ABC transporter substrate-binding protein n=1 Tax=Solihabitans fulvus TaxID=1892852 RepID=UPI003F67AC14
MVTVRISRWRLGLTLGALLVAVGLAAPAVTTAAPTAAAQGGTVLRVALTKQVDSVNPFLSITQAGTELGRLMYEFLTTYDAKDQHPVPALAEKWETSQDKLTWTYTIRSGVRWSDGQPLTAKDVAFTFNLMLTNDVARTANGNFVANFDSVSAPDDRTVVIRTKTPQATMLALDVPIVPEHVWSKVTDIAGYTNDTTPVVGNGPFVLTEYRANESIRFKANKDYWRGAPHYDELDFVIYKNADAATQALIKGEVDLINRLGPGQYDSLKNAANVTLNPAKGRRFNELLFNPGAATSTGVPIGDGNPALRDVKVRQALAKAFNLKDIVSKVAGGYAEPGGGLIPPVFVSYHWQPDASQARSFDPAAANRELDAAGYPRGAGGIRQGPDGKPLTLRLLGHNGTAFDEQTAPYIKQWLSDVGVDVTVQLVSDSQVNEITSGGKYDLAFSGWGANPDPDYILSLHTCSQRPNADGKGGTTDSFLCDPQYDALYTQQLAEFDQAKRAELVKQAQQRFYDLAVGVVLDYDNSLEAYRKDRFADFQVQPDPGGVIMAQNGYWGYYSARPVAGAASSGGGNAGPVIGIAAGAVVVLAVLAFLFARRRRATSAERE